MTLLSDGNPRLERVFSSYLERDFDILGGANKSGPEQMLEASAGAWPPHSITAKEGFMEPTNFRDPARWNAVPVPERVAERAYTRVDVDAETGCWISQYSRASHGYAQIGWQSKAEGRHVVLAHRAAWVHVNGQLPIGMTLDHTCKNKPCVNPGHLRMVSNFENARRTNGQDWEFGKCANRHSNMFLREDRREIAKDGQRKSGLRCSKCRELFDERYAWKKKHPGRPMPSHLLLESEKQERSAAA